MRVVKRIKLKGRVEFTRNLFGESSDLGGKWLDVLEENPQGECLAIHRPASGGPHLVSVDPKDIADEAKTPSNEFFTLGLVRWVEEFIGRSLET